MISGALAAWCLRTLAPATREVSWQQEQELALARREGHACAVAGGLIIVLQRPSSVRSGNMCAALEVRLWSGARVLALGHAPVVRCSGCRQSALGSTADTQRRSWKHCGWLDLVAVAMVSIRAFGIFCFQGGDGRRQDGGPMWALRLRQIPVRFQGVSARDVHVAPLLGQGSDFASLSPGSNNNALFGETRAGR
jgi:hypothetical protein